jgi:hypothetical protein
MLVTTLTSLLRFSTQFTALNTESNLLGHSYLNNHLSFSVIHYDATNENDRREMAVILIFS